MLRSASRFVLAVLVSMLSIDAGDVLSQHSAAAWPRHVIDDSSRGADGVRLADVNGDGLMDIATGWEEGGVVRAYVNPGPRKSKEKWPAVTVGEVGSPEDAVFVDLDADGVMDVVSCCEGKVKTIYVHWAPRDRSRYLDPDAWKTEAFPATEGANYWMFCLPMQVDGKNGVDLVVGAKGRDARIGWLEAPADPRDLSAWKWHPMYDARWIMSLVGVDMDGDGDVDVVASDRKGPGRCCLWLENPGPGEAQTKPWPVHRIGNGDREEMFLVVVDLDRDGLLDVLVATRNREFVYHRRMAINPSTWERFIIQFPPNTGGGKAVNAGDIDLDGRLDIVFTCEAGKGKSGVMWMSYKQDVTDGVWNAHEIGGPEGVKFDLVELLDLDGDGDLDVITCEERTNLGVIWYENPARGMEARDD